MQEYECAVIYAPGVSSEVLEKSVKKYTDVITSGGGTFTQHDDWGKRGLAYEINYHREGFYHFYKFQGGGDIVSELNRQLRIDENVIRHMIVRDDAKVSPKPEPATAEPTESREANHEETEKR